MKSGHGSEDQHGRRLTDLERRLTLLGKQFTVATAPDASRYEGQSIYVTNGAAGSPVMAFSDGANWLRCDTRTAISPT